MRLSRNLRAIVLVTETIMSRAFIFALLISTFAISLFGQSDPINVETNLVTMNVAVTDKSGKYVHGLKQEDFSVMDGNQKRQIEFFSSKDDALSIGVVYDMHEMDEQALNVLEALKRFTSRFGPKDDYFVTVFNERGSITSDFVPDPDQLRRHLADPEKGTPKALYDAIVDAGDRVKKLRNAKKYLIVFSDGADRNSYHSMKDLKIRLRSINLPLYSLVFRDDVQNISYTDIGRNGPREYFRTGEATELDRSVVAELSKSTGGAAYESSIRNRVYLAALATKFLDEARSQYVVGFSPDDGDGRWHKLKITVIGDKGNGLKVSSRDGYLSPAKARQ